MAETKDAQPNAPPAETPKVIRRALIWLAASSALLLAVAGIFENGEKLTNAIEHFRNQLSGTTISLPTSDQLKGIMQICSAGALIKIDSETSAKIQGALLQAKKDNSLKTLDEALTNAPKRIADPEELERYRIYTDCVKSMVGQFARGQK